MDADEGKKNINRLAGCVDYQEMKKVVSADHDQEELKMNSEELQHQEEEKIKVPDEDHHKNEIPPADDDDEVQDEHHEEAAGPSEIQTLRIKIKLPKFEWQNELDRCTCGACGKVFLSRKALGGHWKIHLREEKEKGRLKRIRNNKQLIKSKKLQDSVSNGVCGDSCRTINAGDPVCSICHREFKSWKSLFGHMRSHPDRGWKGIRPPVEQSSTAASSSQIATTTSTQCVDLSRDLFGWTQTGNRGRPSTYCAAASLMNLAHSNPSSRRTTNNRARIEESESKRKKITISDSEAYFKSRDLKIGRGDEPYVPKFKCASCSRSFSSFQALGEHRSSHNRENSGHNIIVDYSMEDDSETEDEDNIGYGSEERKEAHQCDLCDKSFSSGQALGGHKKWHWKEAADQVASSSGEDNQPGRKIFDFDLNEPPNMDEEE